jgi:D-hydroxyproline dehydrogenase subunit gamma
VSTTKTSHDIASADTPDVSITIIVDDSPIAAARGQTVAAALMAAGISTFRRTRVHGKPRGVYCAMGVCFECVVQVEGRTERACMTPVQEGMRIALPQPFESKVSE